MQTPNGEWRAFSAGFVLGTKTSTLGLSMTDVYRKYVQWCETREPIQLELPLE